MWRLFGADGTCGVVFHKMKALDAAKLYDNADWATTGDNALVSIYQRFFLPECRLFENTQSQHNISHLPSANDDAVIWI